jgi:ubiquitin carboxyl-terminal hydrolase 5/13
MVIPYRYRVLMLTDTELETIWSLAELGVKVPRYSDIVHNDECLFSYTTPLSPDGLFVNLKTWKGMAREFVPVDLEVNAGSGVYLWMRHREVSIPKGSLPSVEKLGINVPGGFQTSNSVIEKTHTVVIFHRGVFDSREFELEDENLPEPIVVAANAVAEHRGAYDQQQLVAWENIDERPISKYAEHLVQEPATEEKKRILADSGLWKCELSGETSNLWLNLSDGFIGGGRKNFDGSGGSNGAIDHFDALKKNNKMYPLAVKLGTITPEGAADVYSYEEDCMVTDSLLKQHLLHWGIDITKLSKTEKTLAEMELELNKDFAFDKIVEAAEQLEVVGSIPGMKNLGNTCYLNAVVRLLLALDDMKNRYIDQNAIMRRMLGKDLLMPGDHHPVTRTLFELSKCVTGSAGENHGPLSMASLREQFTFNHTEFSSSRQQDAVEFLLHFLKELTKAERASLTQNLTQSLLSFEFEDRLECDGQVRYAKRSELVLPVQVVKDDMTGNNSPKRARENVSFLHCLERALGRVKLEGFRSPTMGEVSDNTWKSSGIASMPPFLLTSVNRYYFTESYQAAKLDCEVEMPLELDLEGFRGKGLQPGEIEMPQSAITQPTEEVNMEIVNQLAMMGFTENLVRQACVATKNAGPEQALQWCLENPNGRAESLNGSSAMDPEAVMMLTAMGFTEVQAGKALKATEGNAERAADWLLSRADQLDSLQEEPVEKKETNDGEGKYELVGIVSHLGSSTAVGHYVAHIKVDGQWLIFNDELVAKSRKPPINFGYLYLYRRKN